MSRRVVLVGFLMVFCSLSAQADNSSAASAIKRFYDLQRIAGGPAQYRVSEEITHLTPNGSSESHTVVVYIEGPNTTMVVVEYANQKPQLFLRTPQGSWLFTEGLRTPLRVGQTFKIVGAANLADVLGIDLVNGYSIGRTTTAESGATLIASLRANKKGAAYSQARVTIDTASQDLRQITLFDASGTALQEVKLSDYRLVSGNHRLATWTIKDLLFPASGTTTIRFTSVEPSHLPRPLFRPSALAMRQFLSMVKY